MITNSINRAREIIQKKGLFSLFRRILKKTGSLVFSKQTSIWLEKNLEEEIIDPEGLDGFDVIMDDLTGIFDWIKEKNADYPWMYSKKEFSIAEKYDHVIPHVKLNNNIVGYTKVALNRVLIRDYNTLFPLAPNKAMFYDTTILPDYRGKRLSLLLRSKIFPYLREKNIKYIYAHIEPWNTASIKANERAGFRQVLVNKYIRILCFKFHSNNPRKLLS